MLIKNHRFPKRKIALLLGDIVVLIIAPFISVYTCLVIAFGTSFQVIKLSIHPAVLLNIFIFVSFLYLFDQYNFQQDFRRKGVIFRIAAAVGLGAVIIIFIYYMLNIPMLARSVFIVYSLTLWAGFALIRIIYSQILSVGLYDLKTLIVGCGDSGRELARSIQANPHSGLKTIGFLDIKREKQGRQVEGLPVYWQQGSLAEAVRQIEPQLLIVAMRRSRLYTLSKDLAWCAQQGLRVWDTPTAYEYLEKRVPLSYVDDIWLLYANIGRPQIHARHLKRIMDIIVSSTGLLLSLPILLITILAVWLESGRPIILVQKRLGRYGRLIPVYKFRSMYQSEPLPGEKGTSLQDKRITRVGKVIRKLHIDELPQLVNVFKGDLSMIGPRAELFDFIYEYIGEVSKDWESWPELNKAQARPGNPFGSSRNPDKDLSRFIPYIEQRFTIAQGVTGWAQVMHPYVTSTYEDMVKKFEYDLYYIKNMSFTLDIIILLMTVRLVLTGKGK